MEEHHQPNDPRIYELSLANTSGATENSNAFHSGEESAIPQQHHTRVSSMDFPHPQIIEDTTMRASNSDYESWLLYQYTYTHKCVTLTLTVKQTNMSGNKAHNVCDTERK